MNLKKVSLLNFSTDLKRKVQIVNDDDDDSDQEDVKQKRKFNKKFRNKVIRFVKIDFLFFPLNQISLSVFQYFFDIQYLPYLP